MILYITTRCNSNCTHCLSSCDATGIDMTDEVLTTAIDFINRISPLAINISGGEPSLHADLLYIIKRLKHEVRPNSEFDVQPVISLITNGTFYTSDEGFLQQLLETGIFVQVTHDPEYYANSLTQSYITKLRKIKHGKFSFEEKVEHIIRLGKADANNLNAFPARIAPMCFNLRSLVALSQFDFKRATREMEMRAKYCSWAIRPDGSIILSEALTCTPVGYTTDSVQTITQNISQSKCKECVYAKNLLNYNVITENQYCRVFGGVQ